jgi:hypothetical protein
MSDEIIDVEAQSILNGPQEIRNEDGLIHPDPSIIDEVMEESLEQIKQRREEISSLPPFPSEWQGEGGEIEEYSAPPDKLPVNVSLKQEEMQKLIKKYKKYLRSNVSEIRRLDVEKNEG